MHWNHRIVRHTEESGDVTLQICEVYYNEKNQPCGYCDADVVGEDITEINLVLERFNKALTLPVLDEGDINGTFGDETEKDY